MRTHIRRTVAVVAALVLSLTAVPAGPALAFHPNTVHFAAACATPASTDCVVSAKSGTTNGVGGAPLPAGVALTVFKDTVLGYVQVEIKKDPPTGSLADYDVSPTLTTTTEVTIVIRFANTFTPAVHAAVARVADWTWNATTREATVIALPRASSWSIAMDPCSQTTATNDQAAMFLMLFDDTVAEGGGPPTEFLTKFTGGYVSTNAQCFGIPYYDPISTAVKFDLGSPHFATDGLTVNTGFFRVLVPDPVIADLWGLEPLSLTPSGVNVTVGGSSAGVTMTRATGRAPFPDGWIFENSASFTYSTPTVAITPASAVIPDAPAPDDGGAPSLSDSPGAGAVVREGPVRLPLSGTIRMPLTIKGAGASLTLLTDTALTTTAGHVFTGVLQAPFRSTDPTGGKLVSVTTLLATGGPDRMNEIRLGRPARLTLPVPAGEIAADHQPVFVDGGRMTFLNGVLVPGGVAVDVTRLSDRHTVYGLMKMMRPSAATVTRVIGSEPGTHARWAGQSPSVELAPGQLVEATVNLRNTGDRPWVRGQIDKQVNLGTIDSSAYDRGILASVLWGTDRVATATEPVVGPGDVGTFAVRLRAPAVAGTYRVYLRPVVDGVAWLEDEGIYLEIVVR